MGELARHYTDLLQVVEPPKNIEHATLDAPQIQARRDEFFAQIKRSLETRLSALAVETALTTERIISPDVFGEHADVSDELTLHGGQPLAYVLESREQSLSIVRFGTLPVNRVGEQAFRALEEADEGLSYIIFRA